MSDERAGAAWDAVQVRLESLSQAVSARRKGMSDEKATQRQKWFPGTEFVRHSPNGRVEVIHRWSCPHVLQIHNPVGWIWAEGRDPSEWLSLPWFRPCKTCCADLQPKEAA